jgi:hypothetical protein
MRADMHRWHLFPRTMFVLAAALALAVAATFLPDNPYERFQQMDGTLYAHAVWSYERLHFDPTPVDVAIVGDSRAMVGLKSDEIERRLAQRGKTANVINMALEGDGRNQQWIFVQELLKTKQPKVIVLPIHERPHPWGHSSFKYIAPAREVWREAFAGLHDGGKDLMYLPYRQIRLFLAMFLPGSLGVDPHFNAVAHAAKPRDFPVRHINAAGKWVDFSQGFPRPRLLKEARQNAGVVNLRSRFPASIRAITDADDKVYTRLIAQAAAKHGVKLLFVYEPAFHRPFPVANEKFYAAMGPVQDNVDLSEQDALYHDWSHVNTAGAIVLSDRVADALTKLLP